MLQEVDAIREAPSEGVYIHGLFLDGCAWSTRENRLVDSEPKKLFHPLPVLYVTGVLVCLHQTCSLIDARPRVKEIFTSKQKCS